MEDEEDYINVLVLMDETNSASQSIHKDKPGNYKQQQIFYCIKTTCSIAKITIFNTKTWFTEEVNACIIYVFALKMTSYFASLHSIYFAEL
jgi:hypothetical protein